MFVLNDEKAFYTKFMLPLVEYINQLLNSLKVSEALLISFIWFLYSNKDFKNLETYINARILTVYKRQNK